ncbi:hypothetical protein IX39_14155 [Chryseobacterium formosense]|uniref:Immunity protein 35 domain-containing protein n=2 Tax=Chryseobacterium formosense TaxID=236814 RepID=A0A085Z2B0_9FLAO|nr:hypothetical protein IX39_14155 [Chryseobacterium formosense]SFT55104.1 hypothetical protein SAMN05421857_1526 [Chryseobacterium formosense]
MLTDNKMLDIANKYINEIGQEINIELEIPNDFIKKSYGNIYDYVAKDSTKHRLAGNGPFLVKNDVGTVIQFGTSDDIEYYIQGYEDGTWEPSSNGVWDPN